MSAANEWTLLVETWDAVGAAALGKLITEMASELDQAIGATAGESKHD